MAQGDIGFLTYRAQNDEEISFFTPIYCDDNIYNICSSSGNNTIIFSSDDGITIDDVYTSIDGFFGMKYWNLLKSPISFRSEPQWLDRLYTFFPALYQRENTSITSQNCLYNDEIIPLSNFETVTNIVANNLAYSVTIFPFSTSVYDVGGLAEGVMASLLIMPSNFIQEGRMNFPSSTYYYGLRIQIIFDSRVNGYKVRIYNRRERTNNNITNFFNGKEIGIIPSPEDNDPYNPGGTSVGGIGGTGTFEDESIPIGIPSLPTISATDTGFITLFNPTLTQLKNLANYMWSDLFELDGWKKLFADPMEAILGLSIVPVDVPTSGAIPVKVGNISTGVVINVAAQQFIEVDCGTLNVAEFWGAYLDYSPYTKAEIYLPYIGTHPLNIDDIMNKDVHVVYHIDILSGACCAYIQCGGTVLYTFIGQCASSVPISGDSFTTMINGVLSIAGSIGTMVATGGASAPLAVGSIASTAVNTLKPDVEKSGAMSGTGGLMGVQTPYLILTRPRQAHAIQQNHYTGYPSFTTVVLGEMSGYTEVFEIYLDNIPAMEIELTEIYNLLKKGVII